MRLSQSKKKSSKEKDQKESTNGLAQVAIQLGRYVSVQTAQFLQEIRESEDPRQEVAKRTVDDFANAGMPDLSDPFQKESSCRSFIDSIRERFS